MERTYKKTDINDLTFSILQAKNEDELHNVISCVITNPFLREDILIRGLRYLLINKFISGKGNDLDTQKVSLLKVINIYKNY